MAPLTTTSVSSKKTRAKKKLAKTKMNPQSADVNPDSALAEKELITCPFPLEKVNHSTQMEGIDATVDKAVFAALGDLNVRCFLPLQEVAAACKDLQTKIADHKVELDKGLASPIPTDEFAANVEDEFNLNEDYLREELMKYILIASSSSFDKLSAGTQALIVRDLAVNGVRMHEWEAGCPAKLANSTSRYYQCAASEFNSREEQERQRMNKEHIEEGIRYNEDMTSFLAEKDASLKTEMAGPLKDCDKRRVKELVEEVKSQEAIGRRLKKKYALTTCKDEKEDFLALMLGGEKGERSRKEEAHLDALFARTRKNDILKILKEEDKDEQFLLEIRNFPTLRTKAEPL